MKKKFEANLAMKKSGPRSLHTIGKKPIKNLQRAVYPDNPEYIAYKEKISEIELKATKK